MKKIIVLAVLSLVMATPAYPQGRGRENNRGSRHEERRFEQHRYERGHKRIPDFHHHYGEEHRLYYRPSFRRERFLHGNRWFIIFNPVPVNWLDYDECYIEFNGLNWYLFNVRLGRSIILRTW